MNRTKLKTYAPQARHDFIQTELFDVPDTVFVTTTIASSTSDA